MSADPNSKFTSIGLKREADDNGPQSGYTKAKPQKTYSQTLSSLDVIDARKGDRKQIGFQSNNTKMVARALRVLANQLAVKSSKQLFDMLDVRTLDDEGLDEFMNGVFDTKADQFLALEGLFKANAHGAIFSALCSIESDACRKESNPVLHSMTLMEWLKNAQILQKLAQLASFYLVFPKYMATASWPKDAIMVQWKHQVDDCREFFSFYDSKRL